MGEGLEREDSFQVGTCNVKFLCPCPGSNDQPVIDIGEGFSCVDVLNRELFPVGVEFKGSLSEPDLNALLLELLGSSRYETTMI